MFNKHNLLRYLSLIKRVRYHRLSKSRVIIFDAAKSKLIEKLILKDINHIVLPVRNEVFYVSCALFLLFLKNLVWVYLFYRKYWGLYLVYLLSCIEYIKPQVAITFVDNNSLFHALSEICNKVEFYAIQNGVRTKYFMGKPACTNGNGIIHSRVNLFSFGQHEVDLYKRNGFMLNRFYPVGSLIGDYYRKQTNPLPIKYDLCLVSQWRRSIMLAAESSAIRVKEGIITLDGYLNKFFKKRDLSLCIARVSQDSGELDYFKKLYGGKAHIINCNREAFSTYAAMDSSRVVLTFCSSAAYESFGWGKKVLFCNFSGDRNYDFPVESPCSITDADYDKFECKLDWLIKIDNEEYSRLTKEASGYVMSYDCHTAANEFITKRLREVLG